MAINLYLNAAHSCVNQAGEVGDLRPLLYNEGMKKVTLFTKLDCHLCLDAYRLLLEVAYDSPLEIDVVDITHDHNVDFRALYAERIPVVKIPETEAELGWPFTLEELKAFLGA